MRPLIDAIASHLQGLFDKWPGSKSYGLAELIRRNEAQFPGVIKEGDYTGVSPDDRSPVISYHRLQSLGTTQAARTGTGDESDDIINTYTVGLYVYMDRKITKLSNTDLLLFIQANTPDLLTAKPYSKKVIVRFTGAILNSQTVFGTEFQGVQMRLPAEKTMFQFNYTLTTQFRRGCFVECPC